ncbi:cytochrome c biogenesis protein CcsA [Alicyclobacillus sp. SO9]|uniref:cytochrome c biogenesis protein CcsA n=1 Tax=Alicyclobacillus sp. SO9 TaxID=2665646 RepID=UPI001E302D5C|nr:cytochrome c biogenesis protein CcsA [Alicyclobacillus sp. SO9]
MTGKKMWWLIGLTAVMGWVNLYLALIWSPPEAQMGNLVRIMYFHVSSAWIAFLAFFVTLVFSIAYLVSRKLRYDRISVSSAEIGVVFTTITLITGSLWAKPIWNTWWTWDPRLTTTLILWFLYIAYLLLRGTITGAVRRARISAVFGIIAFADVPIIHLSVTLWRSIHPQVITAQGFNMPPSMVLTLLFGFITFLLIYIVLLMLRVRLETSRTRLVQLQIKMQSLRARRSQGVVK